MNSSLPDRRAGRFTRRHFLSAGAVALATALPGRDLRAEAALPPGERGGTPTHPVVTNAGPDGFTILWGVAGGATGWVEYGETPALGNVARAESAGLLPYSEYVLRVRVQGLRPGTKYHYRTQTVPVIYDADKIRRGEPQASDVAQVTTLDPAKAATSFTVWNDTHEHADTLARLSDLTAAADGDFLFWNGDQCNAITSNLKMGGQYLDAGGRPFAVRTPMLYGRGNHEARGVAARYLPEFTDTPEGKFYYSFRQGPVGFIVLDSGEDKDDGNAEYGGLNDFADYREKQRPWLERELAKPHLTSAPYLITFIHIPLWWTNDQEIQRYSVHGRKLWHDLLTRAGVQLVISGHTHLATWLPPDGNHAYGQLIGGGPAKDIATLITARADAARMVTTMQTLDGREVARVELTPRHAS